MAALKEIDTLAHRVRDRRRVLKLSQVELAIAADMNQGDISKIERGEVLQTLKMAQLAHALQCDAYWLATGEGDEPAASLVRAPKQSDDFTIRQFEAGGAMGYGLVLEAKQPGIIKSWNVDREWLRLNVKNCTSPQNLCIVTGFGPSMRPMFNPGDPLLMDRGINQVDYDAVFFFRLGEHGFIKTVQRIPAPAGNGMIFRAKSKNPDYDPFDITPQVAASEGFEVFGKILTVWKSEQL